MDLRISGPVLTTPEVAAALGITRQTVARRVRAGRLEPLRRLPGGRGYLFALQEVARAAAAPPPRRGRPAKKLAGAA